MKKSLFALAALSAFATAAQAQSSVTLYGTMDASVQYIGNGGLDPSVAQTINKTNTGSTVDNSQTYGWSKPAAASSTYNLVDGAIATSVWGMKGNEDLGGGLHAGFDAQSDLLVNNGTTHSSGLFRRAANVSIGGSFGDVYLGLKSNPMADASSASFAVGGNTVHQIRTVIGYSTTDFIKNSIQYQTPVLSGLQARVAYGMSDTIGDNTDGTIMAGSLVYTNGGLRLTGAYNKANAGLTSLPAGSPYQLTSTQITASTAAVSNTYAMFNSAAQSGAYDQSGYILGAKYNFAGLGLPALTLSYNFAHGQVTKYTATNNTTAAASSVANTWDANANAHMVSLGYQATPSLLLGANYIITTADSSFYNLQARYSLSKRTTVYAQGSMGVNGAGSTTSGAAFGNFVPVNTNSSANAVVGGSGTQNIGGMAALKDYQGGMPNTTVSAFGVGIIHSF